MMPKSSRQMYAFDSISVQVDQIDTNVVSLDSQEVWQSVDIIIISLLSQITSHHTIDTLCKVIIFLSMPNHE